MKHLIISISVFLLFASLALDNAIAQRPGKSLNQAIVEGDIDRVKSDISSGADVNSKDGRTGWTLLHIAVRNKQTQIAQLLIDKGADVNAKDNHGKTPMHLAVESGQKAIVEALIAKGADLNVMDGRADNALTLSRKNNQKEITELLIKNGAEEPDLSLLQGDRLYSSPGRPQGANYYQGTASRYQARTRSMTTSQSSVQVDILADPNEIKSRIKTFDGLGKELKVVADKSQDELRHWPQSRYDNRTILARSIEKQIEEELQYVRKVAVKESAKKTTSAIDNLLKSRQERYTKVNRELLQQKRELKQAASMRTRGRGRTTGRNTRGRYSQRGRASGTSTTNTLYRSDAVNMPRGYGSDSSGRPPEQLDPQTQEQIRLWLQTTPDKKLDLAKAVHPLIQAEMGSIRAIAVEEQAKKTTAAIDGLLLARKERFDKLVLKMEEDQRKLQEKLQEAQSRYNRNTDNLQQQNTRGTRTRRR